MKIFIIDIDGTVGDDIPNEEAHKFANKKIGDRFWGGSKSYDPRENPHYKRVRKIYDRIL